MHSLKVPSIVAAHTPVEMGKKHSTEFEPGGKWEIVKEFNGRSHHDGGIDIEVMGGYVRHINSPFEKPDDIAKKGRFWKGLGAALYGAGEGLLDTITLGATDELTDAGYRALQKLGGSTEDEIREQNSLRGYTTSAGAITGGILTGGLTTGSAIQQGAKGLGAGVGYGSPDSKFAQAVGTYLPMAGSIAGLAVGNVGYGGAIKAATKAGEAAKTAGNLAEAASFASKAEKLSKLSKIASTAGKISQFATPAIGIAQAALTNPQTPTEGFGMNSFQSDPMNMPMLMPMMGSQRAAAAGPSGGEAQKGGGGGSSSSAAYSGAYGGGGGEGPIQFRMPPIYQAESAQYLGKYGINV